MKYNVKLDVFEGPLDLLLYFIKRDEINIYDIPISYITREYLDYLEMAQKMDLHLASDFLEMASMLIRIKAKMLLPDNDEEEKEEIEDPRDELVDMLLEYKKYKEVSRKLLRRERENLKHFPIKVDNHSEQYDPDIFLSDVSLFDLSKMFKSLVKEMSEPELYEVEKLDISIKDQELFIIEKMADQDRIGFNKIAQYLESKLEIIVTFLAVLDMVKRQEISVSQDETFQEIYLTRKN